MKGISRVGAPFVWLLSSSTDLILKILGMTKVSDATVSEEEIKAIIEESAAGGIIEVSEQKMVEQVFRLSDHTINMLMTPRIDLVWLDINDSFETNLQLIHENDFTHFLVADGDLDQVLGILHIRDLVKNISLKDPIAIDFKTLAKEPLYVPESMRPFKLLEQFKEHDVHLAIVIDEFGTIQGVITLNDVMQDITDASHDLEDEDNSQIVRREDGTYFVDGMLGKNELKEFLEISELLDEEENHYTTAAGFLMYSLKKVPRLGEHFNWKGIDFEIADMDGNRVDKIIVRFPEQNKEKP
jgi:putative hemolysin